ncbi:TPA: hypothetical protein ACRM5L_004645 [Pseudomonas aeruginosa]|uniref:hypothetical protein n=1 Tax=Pseudomonas aeruginosa TaxID=287 RepID=UPI000A5991C4|nr:hypothetical protein [Pseudomonas aeruginosa]
MSSTQHQLIEQCATRLRGIVEALDNIHDTSPHRWSTDLDDVHSSAESLLALINDQAPTQAAQGLAGAALAQPSPAQAEQAEGAHVPDEVFAGVFAEWWEEEGQYCRAGGGDYERTFAFQAWRHLYPLLLQARAALAQPSPVRSSLLINGYQLRAALDFIAPDGTAEQLESEACIEWRQQDADFLEAGLYAFCAEYPEEGGVLLDEEPTSSQPSPAQAEQAEAEAERPEVVARVDGADEDWFIQPEDETEMHNEGLLFAGCELGRMIDFDRIVGALRAENAKLSEDLNRLSIIRARLNLRLDFALDKISKLESRWPHGESPEERFEHYISNTIDRAPEPLRRLGNWLSHVLDEDQWTTAERMLTGACVAAEERAAAQTQHSVPEEFSFEYRHPNGESHTVTVSRDQVINEMPDFLFEALCSKFCNCEPAGETNVVECCCDEYAEEFKLLAAAPTQAQHSVPKAWLDVQAERRRQVENEGWTPEHDDEHSYGQMGRAAACYALAGSSAPNDGTAALLVSLAWPWDEQWWKPSTARRDLVKACALALAEIERLDRATATQGGPRDA